MRRHFLFLYFLSAALAMLYAIGCSEKKKEAPAIPKQEAIPRGYTPFPSGFNYPLPDSVINKWVASNTMDSIRNHGWNLWAGINQMGASNLPVWRTWFSVSQAFDTSTAHSVALLGASARAGSGVRSALVSFRMHGSLAGTTIVPVYDSSQCGNGDNGEFANNGDIMIAGVIYNWQAYNHIRQYKLYLQDSLRKYLTSPGKAPGGMIPQFPEQSIVLKHMYWPVKGDELSALPVFNDNPAQFGDSTYNGYETWKDAVAIDPNPQNNPPPGLKAVVRLLYGVGHYPTKTYAAPVVSIKEFYYRRIDSTEWSQMTPTDQCIVNHAFQWAYGRPFKPGDYLVSLAMHINTKEVYNWTLQSLWWHPNPNAGPYAQNRPTNIAPGPWQHYLMTTSYNMETPRQPDGSPNVSYNPYIELVVPETFRIVSNCQNCHTRGAFPEHSNVIIHPVGAPGTIPVGDSSYYDAQRRGTISEQDSIFTNLVKTDFQWAIPDRAVATPK